MREHEYYQELMSRLLDESLTAEEETSLREHMRVCPDCRRLGAAFTGMTAALREDLAEPPRDLARGVMERIRDEEQTAAPRRTAGRSARRLRPWIRLGAAACLVLIVTGVATFALRDRAKSSQLDTADARSANTTGTEAQAAESGEDSGDLPMAASSAGGEAVYGLEDAPMEAAGSTEEGVPEDAAPAGEPAPEPSQEPLPVYDAARNRVGSIAPENIPAFQALITDEGWAEGEYEYMLKVEYRQKTYAFATDDSGGLVWWEEPSTQPLRSPGTFAQLHELIAMDPPALPQ